MGATPLETGLAALAGLLVGSFLNVVIHRLPRMLERRWAQEVAAHQAQGPVDVVPDEDPHYNLVHPRSACPACGHVLRWYENIPVASWLLLRGRCSACRHRIGLRYPLVELATAALFGFAAARWGVGGAGAAWAAFGSALLALALIDWDSTLLPDDLTLPLMWGGLLASAQGWTGVPLEVAVWGAVAGYLFLWTVFHGFRLLTGKEGMGYGDFKLLAALGAWFGWPALIPLVLMSSILGAFAGGLMKVTIGLVEGKYVQFGPWLAAAGAVAMVMGQDRLVRFLGL